MQQGPWKALEILERHPIRCRAQQSDGPGRYPFVTALRYHLGRTGKVLGIEQKGKCEFPLFVFEKNFRDPVSFGQNTRLPYLGPQSPLQEIPKKRMKTILLSEISVICGSK